MAPLWISLEVSLLATLGVAAGGLPLAWALARMRRRFSRAVEAVLLTPLVVPPTVTGLALLWLLGPHGPLGRITFALLGESLLFTRVAAVLAAAVVSFPLFLRTARAALEAVPSELVRLARMLGDSPLRAALRVELPLARRGLVAGLALGFGRAMGEFGATLMVAGNQPRTETLALAVYNHTLLGEDQQAWGAALLLTGAAVVVLTLVARMEGPE